MTIADDGSHSGSGLALALYLAIHAQKNAQVTAIVDAFNNSMADAPDEVRAQLAAQRDEQTAALLRSWAQEANILGPAIVDYLKANAVVSLTGAVATLDTTTSAGRLPALLTPGDPIDPPAADVSLPVTGGGTLT